MEIKDDRLDIGIHFLPQIKSNPEWNFYLLAFFLNKNTSSTIMIWKFIIILFQDEIWDHRVVVVIAQIEDE